MTVKIKDGQVKDVQLRIYEPPRFFEAFLRGRDFREAPDITSRICGICPIAYLMGACHAMESALGVKVEGPLRDLRRLIYCGEWIESHALHVYLLHAPDFLGYESAIHMSKDHADLVAQGLKLKKVGNDILALIGGREIHPVNLRVGGFYKVPSRRDLAPLAENLKWAVEAAEATVRFTGTLPFPDFQRTYEYVSLRHPTEYPIEEGRLASSQGLDIAIPEYERNFEEEHVQHSNALHSKLKERGSYFVGPSARYNLNFDRLTPRCREEAKKAGIGATCNNPFQSIVIRAVETLYACEEALRIIGQYEMPDSPSVPIEPKAGTGFGCTEAPRGICYHRYRIDEKGTIADAKIVPPTSQNQKVIEEDLRSFVTRHIELPDDKLRWQCEQAIRNYDPCISCATHFLTLTVERD